jgi:hypothetical protein
MPDQLTGLDHQSQRREKKLHTCIHFTGIQNQTCKANVPYEKARDESTKPYKFACLDADTDVCPLREYPTSEQVDAAEAEMNRRLDQLRVAMPACRADAKSKGFGKGHGGQSSIACPVCESGTLRYSVAGYNGHMHGRCTTEGCMSWMQ